MTIQEMVEAVIWDEYSSMGAFHINWVRVGVWGRWGVSLSYKQARNAMYRLRWLQMFEHVGLGVYRCVWSHREKPIRFVRLYAAVTGGIYYRRLAVSYE